MNPFEELLAQGFTEEEARIILIKEMIQREEMNPLRLWHLWFNDENGFLGFVFVEARGLIQASREAHRRGINPGGDMLGEEMSEENASLISEGFRNRLLSKDDVSKLTEALSS